MYGFIVHLIVVSINFLLYSAMSIILKEYLYIVEATCVTYCTVLVNTRVGTLGQSFTLADTRAQALLAP